MATVVEPVRPNVASASVPLPGVRDYEQVDNDIAATLAPSRGWFILLAVAIACFLWGALMWTYQIYWGLGNAGYQPPVMWGVYIINFVFWIGIGHAGTLISAILFLFRAGFRTTIYRCAEAMTVFAVMTAGLFPIIHIGRPWKFFWLVPYPNWRLIWPNFKSPLVWDVFAISTYLTVSSTFLYLGLIPDLAVLRDRATNPLKRRILGILSLGWRNWSRSGGTSRGCICSWRPSPHRWCCRCTRSCRSTSPWRWSPAGTRRSSRPISSPARSSRGWGWCSRSSSRSGSSSSSSTS
jgi:molybdopterin-containing oxidoreductase family membrane subunit